MSSLLNSLNSALSLKYVFKMNPNDALIIYKENNHAYYILEGILIIHKCFSNKEIFTVSILVMNSVINLQFPKSFNNNYFYTIEAITTSYIIKLIRINTAKQNFQYTNINSRFKIIPTFYNTSEILIHRTVKQRLTYFLLQLSKICGIENGHKVYLMVKLNHQTLGYVTGTSQHTIRRIIKSLIDYDIIDYQKQYIIIKNLPLLTKFHNY